MLQITGGVKVELARRANLARKAVLEEVQSGVVMCGNKTWEIGELDYKRLQDVIETMFSNHLRKQE